MLIRFLMHIGSNDIQRLLRGLLRCSILILRFRLSISRGLLGFRL
jgi:hypothetical protein